MRRWMIAIVVSAGCNNPGPKAAPRAEPTPAEGAALLAVLPATPDLPRPTRHASRQWLVTDELLAVELARDHAAPGILLVLVLAQLVAKLDVTLLRQEIAQAGARTS